MKRFIVRPQEICEIKFDPAKGGIYEVEETVWMVIDSTTNNMMTTRQNEKIAYEAAAELERSHAVKRRNERGRR